MPDKPLFITGIGTGIGKTIVSAVLVEKLKADYWKPIQSGDLDNSDTLKVNSLVTNSPHKSAAIDGITIDPEKIILPDTNRTLIIEGAGGLMVPLNDRFLMIDLIRQLNAEVILVSQNYLGSINHTLLSVYTLKQYQIPVKGIIFNGLPDIYSETFIRDYSKLNIIGHMPRFENIDNQTIMKAGDYLDI